MSPASCIKVDGARLRPAPHCAKHQGPREPGVCCSPLLIAVPLSSKAHGTQAIQAELLVIANSKMQAAICCAVFQGPAPQKHRAGRELEYVGDRGHRNSLAAPRGPMGAGAPPLSSVHQPRLWELQSK
jgi:hypothetical protein